MGKGKLCAQVGHAVLGGYSELNTSENVLMIEFGPTTKKKHR